ncbi:MAG: T9SS type A sorting domain-containing protein, partial [Bacteroidota bacterium]
NNQSSNQGGAISTQRAGFNVLNSVFVGNTIGTDGVSGGAIIFNGNSPGLDPNTNEEVLIGDVPINVLIANSTFVDNFKGTDDAAVGDNIALFQPGDTDNGDSNTMTITLINNAFLLGNGNPSLEVELGNESMELGFTPIGNLTVTSLGGNFFNTENGPNIPTFDDMTGDFMDEDVDYESLFVDLLDDEDMGVNVDLAILGDSGADNPLIGNGVTNAVIPDMDIRGNPRGDLPDIGAYEADQSLVDTDEPVENSGLALRFYPNPTIDVLNIENEDPAIAKFHVMVTDQMGRILKAAQFNGSVNSLDLSAMPSGVYNLRLFVNGSVYSKQVVKQ